MDDKLFSELLSSGFAIAVSGFLLIRLERDLRELRNSIERLARCQICRFEPTEPAK